MDEAKEVAEEKSTGSKIDEYLSKEKEAPSESSPEEKPEVQAETEKPAETDSEKTEQVKEVDSDESLSADDKISKIKEILGEDEKAIDAYIKSKGYHKDPAWIKQREIIDRQKEELSKPAISEEMQTKLEQVDKVLSNPNFVKFQMQQEGYKDEAINQKLRDMGVKVDEKPTDSFQFVLDKFGVKLNELDDNGKQYVNTQVQDMVKVFDLLFGERMTKAMDERTKPIEDKMAKQEHASRVSSTLKDMETIVKDEGNLDYKKDIEPALVKIIDEHETKGVNITSPEFLEFLVKEFHRLNHGFTIDRLKTKGKKEDRDAKGESLRSKKPGVHIAPGKKPALTGDSSKDIDAYLDVSHKE